MTEYRIIELVNEIYEYREMFGRDYEDKKISIQYRNHDLGKDGDSSYRVYNIRTFNKDGDSVIVFSGEFIWDKIENKYQKGTEEIIIFRHSNWEKYLSELPQKLEKERLSRQTETGNGISCENLD